MFNREWFLRGWFSWTYYDLRTHNNDFAVVHNGNARTTKPVGIDTTKDITRLLPFRRFCVLLRLYYAQSRRLYLVFWEIEIRFVFIVRGHTIHYNSPVNYTNSVRSSPLLSRPSSKTCHSRRLEMKNAHKAAASGNRRCTTRELNCNFCGLKMTANSCLGHNEKNLEVWRRTVGERSRSVFMRPVPRSNDAEHFCREFLEKTVRWTLVRPSALVFVVQKKRFRADVWPIRPMYGEVGFFEKNYANERWIRIRLNAPVRGCFECLWKPYFSLRLSPKPRVV